MYRLLWLGRGSRSKGGVHVVNTWYSPAASARSLENTRVAREEKHAARRRTAAQVPSAHGTITQHTGTENERTAALANANGAARGVASRVTSSRTNRDRYPFSSSSSPPPPPQSHGANCGRLGSRSARLDATRPSRSPSASERERDDVGRLAATEAEAEAELRLSSACLELLIPRTEEPRTSLMRLVTHSQLNQNTVHTETRARHTGSFDELARREC